MKKSELEARLIMIDEQLNELVEAKKQLQKEIHLMCNSVLMWREKKGKLNFVLHPFNQQENLIENGWKKISKDELLSMLNKYDLR